MAGENEVMNSETAAGAKPPATSAADPEAGAAHGSVAPAIEPAKEWTPAAQGARPAMDSSYGTVDASSTGQEKGESSSVVPEPNWGSKVYHGVLAALGGSNDIAYERDPTTGKMVATATRSGPGTQWKRIISGALTGASAAAQHAGTGPGRLNRAFGLGFGAETEAADKADADKRKNADQDFNAQQKLATENAQRALLSHQIAESTFRLGRAQMDAAKGDTDRETAFFNMENEAGEGNFVDLGVLPSFNPHTIDMFKQNPKLHDLMATGNVIALPHVDASGKIDGVHVAVVKKEWMDQKTTKDLKFPITEIGEDGKPKEDSFTVPAGAYTNGQMTSLLLAQSKENVDQLSKQAKEKDAEELHRSEITKNYAEANKANREAVEGADSEVLTDMIGRGQMPIGRLSYVLARKPQILDAVAKKYPGFDASKVEGYTKVLNEFESTKPGTAGYAINSGGTVLTHLNQLRKLNTTQSHIPGTPDWKAYHAQVNVISDELGKFYNADTIPGIKGFADSLGSNLPGTRDAGIKTVANSMLAKFDSYREQWTNAAPSPVYEAKLPWIAPEHEQSRLELAQAYKIKALPTPGAQQVEQIKPSEPTAMAADGKTKLVVRNGQWVPAQ